MKTLRKAGAVAALALALGACAPVANHAATRPAHIEEDSPMWNCRTMGNRVCGTDVDIVERVTRFAATDGVDLSALLDYNRDQFRSYVVDALAKGGAR